MICPGCGAKICSISASRCLSFSLIICALCGNMWPRDDTGRPATGAVCCCVATGVGAGCGACPDGVDAAVLAPLLPMDV